jgi:hypothetical protein
MRCTAIGVCERKQKKTCWGFVQAATKHSHSNTLHMLCFYVTVSVPAPAMPSSSCAEKTSLVACRQRGEIQLNAKRK